MNHSDPVLFTSDTPASTCPACGARLDRATAASRPEAILRPGDISICFTCGAVNLFGPDLTVHAPSSAELEALRASDVWPQISRAVRALVRAKRETPPRPEAHP